VLDVERRQRLADLVLRVADADGLDQPLVGERLDVRVVGLRDERLLLRRLDVLLRDRRAVLRVGALLRTAERLEPAHPPTPSRGVDMPPQE
jgi:hypothetical protein